MYVIAPSTTVDNRPALTLADLEAFDSGAPDRGARRRFCCPLPACADKPVDQEHRSLSVNTSTGAWTCFRCTARGQLKEHWQPRRGGDVARRVFAITPPDAPRDEATAKLDQQLRRARPLAASPAALYLETARGIPECLASDSGVRWAPDWFGRPAAVFPLCDRSGAVVAANGRFLTGEDPKAMTAGNLKLGVFTTPGALDADLIVITEAAIDALSLATVGVPAIALCGLNAPRWLAPAASFRRVALAFDADVAGDEAAAGMSERFASFGARVERWRPAGGKDWNELLRKFGMGALVEAVALLNPPAAIPSSTISGSNRGTLRRMGERYGFPRLVWPVGATIETGYLIAGGAGSWERYGVLDDEGLRLVAEALLALEDTGAGNQAIWLTLS